MRILLTAFDVYDEWSHNSSWLAMCELLKERPSGVELVTRRYPINLDALRTRLDEDLKCEPDAILHLGQAPGAAAIKLEAVALNVAGLVDDNGQELPFIVEQGPLAFRSLMPLGRWSQTLRSAGIPAAVSYHAGTYLCNAVMYLSHYWHLQQGVDRPIGFVHLPLATEQVAAAKRSYPSLPVATLATAVRLLLADLTPETANERMA